jgi:phosphoribosylanthranilate isomerase
MPQSFGFLMCKVKICGIKSVHDARLADRSGADALGLLVGQTHTSKDFISPQAALEIYRAISPFIVPVLVTHLEDPESIVKLARLLPCPTLQLHGDMTTTVLRKLSRVLRPKKLIARVSVEGEKSIQRARELSAYADAIVLDTIDRSTDRVGGTGLVHDWAISARIVRQSRVPVVLAGGLTPENVAEAIRIVKPWGVDVNSGVKKRDGGKDLKRMTNFIKRAKGIEE